MQKSIENWTSLVKLIVLSAIKARFTQCSNFKQFTLHEQVQEPQGKQLLQ